MSGIQTEIVKYEKKQEKRNHNQEKNQLIETGPELTQMLELSERDIKIVIITIFYVFKRLGHGRYKRPS